MKLLPRKTLPRWSDRNAGLNVPPPFARKPDASNAGTKSLLDRPRRRLKVPVRNAKPPRIADRKVVPPSVTVSKAKPLLQEAGAVRDLTSVRNAIAPLAPSHSNAGWTKAVQASAGVEMAQGLDGSSAKAAQALDQGGKVRGSAREHFVVKTKHRCHQERDLARCAGASADRKAESSKVDPASRAWGAGQDLGHLPFAKISRLRCKEVRRLAHNAVVLVAPSSNLKIATCRLAVALIALTVDNDPRIPLATAPTTQA